VTCGRVSQLCVSEGASVGGSAASVVEVWPATFVDGVVDSAAAAATAAAATGPRVSTYPVMLQRTAQATVASAPRMALQQML
jgi:hypothetical protein